MDSALGRDVASMDGHASLSQHQERGCEEKHKAYLVQANYIANAQMPLCRLFSCSWGEDRKQKAHVSIVVTIYLKACMICCLHVRRFSTGIGSSFRKRAKSEAFPYTF